MGFIFGDSDLPFDTDHKLTAKRHSDDIPIRCRASWRDADIGEIYCWIRGHFQVRNCTSSTIVQSLILIRVDSVFMGIGSVIRTDSPLPSDLWARANQPPLIHPRRSSSLQTSR